MSEDSANCSNLVRSHSGIAPQSPVARFANRKRLAMAELLGESPNPLDDLFKDLEDWEAILSALPELGVDQSPEPIETPAPPVD